MKIFKIILLSILPYFRIFWINQQVFSLTSSPVTRDTPMDKESPTGKQIRRRSTGDDRCREMVVTFCKGEKKYFPSKDGLQLFEQCKNDGFAYYCKNFRS